MVDVTADSGIDFVHGAFRWALSADPVAVMGGGACWLDADGDGWLDLYVVNTWAEAEHADLVADGGLPTSTLYRNDAGHFADVGAATGTVLEVRGQGCLATDLDADEDPDLYVTTSRTNVLLWNNGDGTFTQDDGSAGLDLYGWHTAAAAADVNGDGWVDVFVGGYADTNTRREGASSGFPGIYQPVADRLMMGAGPGPDGAVTFVEAGPAAGIDGAGAAYALGALFTDIDHDGDPDLLVANDTDPNRLYRNDSADGRVALVEVGRELGADDDGSGMGVAAGDLDGNGTAELLVTNLTGQGHALLRRDDAAYVDDREALGRIGSARGHTGWGASMADLDLDGWLDLLVVAGGVPVTDLVDDADLPVVLRSTTDGLVDASSVFGVDELSPLIARGSAVADYDNDGDPDVVVVGVAGPAMLLANDGGGGGWLVVDPAGRVPGTVITVTLPDGRVLRREIHAGSSYLSTEDPRALFGLGQAEVITRVEVVWPDGASAVLDDVPANQRVVVGRPG